LSLVLWEKLFGGCLAGGHFFAGRLRYSIAGFTFFVWLVSH
jgi:hypothetical protein